jgi:hypothetical protein
MDSVRLTNYSLEKSSEKIDFPKFPLLNLNFKKIPPITKLPKLANQNSIWAIFCDISAGMHQKKNPIHGNGRRKKTRDSPVGSIT